MSPNFARDRPLFTLKIEYDRLGVPREEELFRKRGYLQRAPFGTLVAEFLKLPELEQYWDLLYPMLDTPEYPKPEWWQDEVREAQDRVRRYIDWCLDADSEYCVGPAGKPVPPMLRFMRYSSWDEVERYIGEKVRRVSLWLDTDLKPSAYDINRRVKDIRRRTLAKSERLDLSFFDAKDWVLSEMLTFEWGYASDDPEALVWMEILLCVKNNLFWRRCDMCGENFITPTLRFRGCPSCRSKPDYSAARQRKRRRGSPSAGRERRRNADRMRLLRGRLSPEEFIRKYPDYTPRPDSEVYKRIIRTARKMVRDGSMKPEHFARMFPKKK